MSRRNISHTGLRSSRCEVSCSLSSRKPDGDVDLITCSGDNIIPALFNSLPTIRGSDLGARIRAGVALFDLLVLPLAAVSRQVAVTLSPICQEENFFNPGLDVSIKLNLNSILTYQRPIPDVRLGHTPTRHLPRARWSAAAIRGPSCSDGGEGLPQSARAASAHRAGWRFHHRSV